MKNIVVTGSNGLLGQSLVNLLLKEKQKYNVIGFSRGKIEVEEMILNIFQLILLIRLYCSKN